MGIWVDTVPDLPEPSLSSGRFQKQVNGQWQGSSLEVWWGQVKEARHYGRRLREGAPHSDSLRSSRESMTLKKGQEPLNGRKGNLTCVVLVWAIPGEMITGGRIQLRCSVITNAFSTARSGLKSWNDGDHFQHNHGWCTLSSYYGPGSCEAFNISSLMLSSKNVFNEVVQSCFIRENTRAHGH